MTERLAIGIVPHRMAGERNTGGCPRGREKGGLRGHFLYGGK